MPASVSTFPNGMIPVCKELPPGVEALSDGTTVASLALREGHYRTSKESHTIIECFNEKACKGGTDVDDYCATGYEGPCKHAVGKYASGSRFPLPPAVPQKS